VSPLLTLVLVAVMVLAAVVLFLAVAAWTISIWEWARERLS